MEDYVLIIGADVSLRERSLAGALRAASGRPVFTVSLHKEAPGLRYFDGSLYSDIADHDTIIAAAEEHARRTGAKPFAVVPTNDFTVTSAALVARHFSLPHNPLRSVELCRDKLAMKQAFANAGVPVPKFAGFTSYAELEQLAGEFAFPVVIKPRQMAGSLGVIKVDRAEDLADIYERSVAAVESLSGQANSPEDLFQIEEYIDYPYEVSVEVAHLGGERFVLAVTDKQLGEEPYFVELGHVVPSVHTANAALIDWALRACEVLGIEYGVAHFEAKVGVDGDIRVIEVAARTGGDSILDLVEDVYGVNPYELHVRSYLGQEADHEKLTPRGIAAVAFLKAPSGTLTEVRKSAGILNSPDIKFYSITAQVGDRVLPLTSWREREGFVRFTWPDREVAYGGEPLTDNLVQAREIVAEIFAVD
ncbi:ATP-grasp domain-containing protein [Streptomyces sp. NPDC051664]|uniref:ATP-grasp domain-containing protein n=1 Tax=Streptomyces sp. NPDC051664 TaxID=3365668 RepID=UPI0037B3D903